MWWLQRAGAAPAVYIWLLAKLGVWVSDGHIIILNVVYSIGFRVMNMMLSLLVPINPCKQLQR